MISPWPEQSCDFPERLHKINYNEQYEVFFKGPIHTLTNLWRIILTVCAVSLVLCTDTVGILYEILLRFITLVVLVSAVIKMH